MLNYVKIAKNINEDLINAVINVREYNGKTVVFAVDPKLENRCGPVTTKKYKRKIITNWFLTSAATDTDFDDMHKKLVGANQGKIISNWYLISAATAADFDTMRKELVGA